MSYFYSKTTGGFYLEHIHGSAIPSDAVEITDDYYQSLFDGQGAGFIISSNDDGYPIIKNRPAASKELLAENARTERDMRLSKTDHLVMPDYPIPADLLSKVKVYRQALRDITNQDGFPTDISWPVNPMDEVVA